MTKNLKGDNTHHLQLIVGLFVVLLNSSVDKCSAENSQKIRARDYLTTRRLQSVLEDFPWLDQQEVMVSDEEVGFLSRVRRAANETSGSKSVWAKIEEFYSDKNNMAMFCVLPVMVLIYGGCSAIYCIYKCRQYMRRRKHRKLKEEDCESMTSDKTDLSLGSKDQPVSQISNAWSDVQGDPSEKRWSGQTEGKPLGKSSPLPWQTSLTTTAAVAHAKTMNGPRASYLQDRMSENNQSFEGGKGKPFEDAQRLADSDPDKSTHNPFIRQPPAGVRAVDPQPFEESRAHVNMADYATNRSSATKATDFSRFSDSRPIEIIPLSADPNLRVWDPLHKRPLGRDPMRRVRLSDQPGGSGERPTSVQEMKEELLAKYDALSTLQMAKRAAQILSINAVEKNPFQRKPNKKKHIFIAE